MTGFSRSAIFVVNSAKLSITETPNSNLIHMDVDQSFLPIPSPVKAAIFESFARQNNVGFPVDTNTDFIYADCSQSLFNKLVICCILEGGTIHYASQQAPMGSIYVSAAKFFKAIIVTIPGQSEVGFDTCDNTRSRL